LEKEINRNDKRWKHANPNTSEKENLQGFRICGQSSMWQPLGKALGFSANTLKAELPLTSMVAKPGYLSINSRATSVQRTNKVIGKKSII